MPTCSQCGNDYDKSFTVIFEEEEYTFDCFECAIHILAPVCGHCGCKVVGHGVESHGVIFCCAHCAQTEGIVSIQDRDDA